MPLNWNIEKCKDVESIKGEEEWGITQTIIFTTMPVAMGSITESNWKEFLFRVKVIEKMSGALMNKAVSNGDPSRPYLPEPTTSHIPVYFTPKMIKRRIGLHTNVSTETRAAWMKGYVKNLFQNIEREIEREDYDEKKVVNG